MIYRGQGGGGMFGGMYGPQGGGGWGGQQVSWQPRGGGYRYDAGPQRTGGMFAPPPQNGGGYRHMAGDPQMSGDYAAGQDVMPTMQPQTDAGQGMPGGSPWGAQGFTGNEWMGGQRGAIDPGRNMTGTMIPGFNVNQRAAAPQQPPQQTLEQFQSTLGNAGAYTSGQVSDMYQKSIQPQAVAAQSAPNGIYNGNIGPGGTQNPYPGNPNPFPSNWGAQTFNFDPRAMAGKNVGQDMAWYYGQDSVGRGVNAQGNAVPSFPGAADGYNRSRPWFGR